MLNDKIIKALEDKGFKRWTKNGMDRLYINAEALGLNRETYEYRGERVSNNLAREMLAAKTYIDIETEQVVSNSWTLKTDARAILDEIMETATDEPENVSESDDLTDMSDNELMIEKNILNSRSSRVDLFFKFKRSNTEENRAELEAELSDIKSRWIAINSEIARRGLTRDIALGEVNSMESAKETINNLEDEISDDRDEADQYTKSGDIQRAFRVEMEIIEYQSCIDAIKMRYPV